MTAAPPDKETDPGMTTRTRLVRTLRTAATVLLPLALAMSAAGTVQAAVPAPASGAARTLPADVRNACAAVPAGQARCLAQIRTDVSGGLGVRGPMGAAGAADAALPAGYGPADLRSAYDLPATGGADQTVALVDAYDDPTAEADLAVYRATYGLPACTTGNGCFRKVDQDGAASPLPQSAGTSGWATETALDLDMVSAACPQCHILLVEADEPTEQDLAQAVDSAAALGATEVSNSYGGTERNGDAAFAGSYSHPGVAVVASSGDSGYGVPSAPAVYPGVVAVGGTSLTPAGNARGWQETAWSGAGSGCSAWFAKPAWQQDTDCPGRTVADVSAVADPQTGLATYNTTGARAGWSVVGGTSAAAPLIAGVIALAGNPSAFSDASRLYSAEAAAGLNDVVAGSNGNCAGDYLCTGTEGYDGPTGNGTPNGLSAF
ncbi:S53 family peptidase [Actinacidiphila sp. bgisy145]|uniref:S53 family peptidase n=1 Tax=Actinacidiphila sp. bgisy145 TaxID=3413792 RepID=UPI003EB87D4D